MNIDIIKMVFFCFSQVFVAGFLINMSIITPAAVHVRLHVTPFLGSKEESLGLL